MCEMRGHLSAPFTLPPSPLSSHSSSVRIAASSNHPGLSVSCPIMSCSTPRHFRRSTSAWLAPLFLMRGRIQGFLAASSISHIRDPAPASSIRTRRYYERGFGFDFSLVRRSWVLPCVLVSRGGYSLCSSHRPLAPLRRIWHSRTRVSSSFTWFS